MKKALSVFLAAIMLFSCVPVSASAADNASDANSKVDVSLSTDVSELPTIKVIVDMKPKEGYLVGANFNLLFDSELVEWKLDHADAYKKRITGTNPVKYNYYGISFSRTLEWDDDSESYKEKAFAPSQISVNEMTVNGSQSASVLFSGNTQDGIYSANEDGSFTVTYYFTAKNDLLMDGGSPVFTLLTSGEVGGKDAFSYNAVDAGANISVTALKRDTLIATAEIAAKEIASIAVKTAPTKTEYTYGETFDPAGMEITVTFDDDSTTDVSAGFTCDPDGDTVLEVSDEAVTVSYQGKTTTQAITVAPAALTVTADAKSKSYGADDPALTYTYSGLVNGDTDAVFSGALARDEGDAAGEYDIVLGTLSAGANYAISYTGAKLTISKVDSALSTAPQGKTGLAYTGSAQALTEGGQAAGGTIWYCVSDTDSQPGDGADWTTTVPEGTDAKTYYVFYKVVGDGNHNDIGVSDAIAVSIATADASVTTAPAAVQNLSYTGKAQTLITAGTASGGEMRYSLDGTTYGEALPTGTDAGSYTVYYKVKGDTNHNDSAAATVTVTIAKADASVTTSPAAVENLGYTGDAQTLITAGAATGGEMRYSLDGTTYGEDLPTGTNAGSYTVYYKVKPDDNHNETAPATVTVTIAQLEATLSWSNTSFSYDGTAHAPTASVGNKVGTDDVTVTVTGGQTNAGSYTATASGLTGAKAGNYKLPSAKTASFSIAKVDYTGAKTAEGTVRSNETTTGATLTLPALPDGASYAASGTASGELISANSVGGTTLTYSTTSQPDSTSGTITIAVTGATNYNDYNVVVTITAKDKEDAGAAITGGDKTVTYGDTGVALAGTVTNAGTNGGWTWESGDPNVATVANDGTVTVVITAKYVSDETIGSAQITLTVNQQPITVSGVTAQDKTYDGTTAATLDTANAVLTGKLAADDLGVSATVAFADAQAGDSKTVNISDLALTGSAAANYVLAATGQQTTATAKISKASITAISGVTAEDKTYDGTTAATLVLDNAVLTGKLDNDTLSITATGAFADANASDTAKTVTVGNLALAGTAKDNYELAANVTVNTVTAKISKATITAISGITASDRTYDGTTAATLVLTGAALTGKVSTDDLSITATGAFADANAADTAKTVTLSNLALAGTAKDNYTLDANVSLNTVTAKINKAAITVSGITANTKTYDGTTAATLDYSGASLAGKLGTEDVSVTATGAFADADAGENKTVTISNLALTGSAAGNYVLAATGQQATATATITKAGHTNGSATGEAKFGKSGTVDLSSLLEGGTAAYASRSDADSILAADPTVTDGVLSFQFVDDVYKVGKDAEITVNVTDMKNYNDFTITVTVTVGTKNDQTLSFADTVVNKTYGDAAYTLAVSGAQTGVTYSSSNEDVASVDASGKVTIKAAGSAVISASAVANDDYFAAGPVSYTLNVAKKAVTVKADDKSKTAGTSDPTLTATVTGLVGSDTIAYSVSRAAGETAGTYVITPSGDAEQGSYAVTYQTGTLTVFRPADNDPDPTPAPTPSGTETETTTNDDGSVTETKTETSTVTNADGSVTETENTIETTTAPDGSKTESVTETETTTKENADGTTTTGVTTDTKVTETDAEGNQTVTESKYEFTQTVDDDGNGTSEYTITETVTDAEGNQSTTVTEAKETYIAETRDDGTQVSGFAGTMVETSDDGSKAETVTELEITSRENEDGTIVRTLTEKETFTETDANGNQTVTQTQIASSQFKDAEGNGTTESIITETVTDPDGNVSTTVTEVREEAEVYTAEDGSRIENAKTTETVTDAEGNQTTTVTNQKQIDASDGSIGVVDSDEEGNTLSASAFVSEQAVAAAAESGEPVVLPIEVKAADSAEEAAEVTINLPEEGRSVKVEIPVSNPRPGAVAVIVNENGEEKVVTLSTVGENGVILTLDSSATVKLVDNAKRFIDVTEDVWYDPSVDFVSGRELFKGVSENEFAPYRPMNRAMLATVLFRLEGAAAKGKNPFDDVPEGTWYTDAVIWANENGIVTGTDRGFEPDLNVTREQIATMIFRYVKLRGIATDIRGDLSIFADGDQVSDWAAEAMAWAVGVGLFRGNELGELNPKGDATRAEVAVLIERLVNLIAQ